MNNYHKSKKWEKTWKNYKKNNKEKISESNRKYYLKVTKPKRMNKQKKNKIPDKPRVEIINKPIVISFN